MSFLQSRNNVNRPITATNKNRNSNDVLQIIAVSFSYFNMRLPAIKRINGIEQLNEKIFLKNR